MSKNIIRIQLREDGNGYQITESGFNPTGNEPFLLISESYIIKKGKNYLICFEKAIPSVRMGGIKKDIESTINETSDDEDYSRARALELVRSESNKILEERHSQGYVLEDLT